MYPIPPDIADGSIGLAKSASSLHNTLKSIIGISFSIPTLKITSLFADKNISIDEMHQKMLKKNQTENDVIIVVKNAQEKEINSIINDIQKMNSNVGNVVKIRLEELAK